MLNRRIPLIAAVLATLVACDSDTSGPETGDETITFTVDGSTRTLSGTPRSALLTQNFVAARADSVGGIVAVGYESAGNSSGNLFVLQAPRSTGTFVILRRAGSSGAGGGSGCASR